MTDTVLAGLRRLYHHLMAGGRTTPEDERRTGISPMTPETLSAAIRDREERQTPYVDYGLRDALSEVVRLLGGEVAYARVSDIARKSLQGKPDGVRNALAEIEGLLAADKELMARSALHFTVWDIVRRALRGENYPWGYPSWRDGEVLCPEKD